MKRRLTFAKICHACMGSALAKDEDLSATVTEDLKGNYVTRELIIARPTLV